MTATRGAASQQPEQSSAASVASRYHDRLVVYALRRLGEYADAQDAAQETLRRVVEAMDRGRVRDLDALPGFVFRTAQHVCQQALRSRAREQRALSRLADEAAHPAGPLTSMLDCLVTDERRAAVRDALWRLRAEDRNLLQFFYAQGLDADDVAHRIGIASATVRVRKHRALKRLGKLLGDDETIGVFREPEDG